MFNILGSNYCPVLSQTLLQQWCYCYVCHYLLSLHTQRSVWPSDGHDHLTAMTVWLPSPYMNKYSHKDVLKLHSHIPDIHPQSVCPQASTLASGCPGLLQLVW